MSNYFSGEAKLPLVPFPRAQRRLFSLQHLQFDYLLCTTVGCHSEPCRDLIKETWTCPSDTALCGKLNSNEIAM